MGRLENKVAIVTGAAGGMGAAEARLFAKEGAYVVATDVQEGLLNETVSNINAEYGERVIGLKHDVSSEHDWIVVVEEAVKKFGKIDVLVNNAGIYNANTNVTEIDVEDFEKILSINVTGSFLGIKHVVPEMKKNKSGSIINISSVAGLVGGQGGTAYTASKGAVRLLTKSTALNVAKDGIRVNSVHPGAIMTPILEKAYRDNGEGFEDFLKSYIPIGYVAEPEDVAYPVLFLASDESRYMTGSEVVVDGGITTG